MGSLPSLMLVGSLDQIHNYLANPAKGVQTSLLLNLCKENNYSREGQRRRGVGEVGVKDKRGEE